MSHFRIPLNVLVLMLKLRKRRARCHRSRYWGYWRSKGKHGKLFQNECFSSLYCYHLGLSTLDTHQVPQAQETVQTDGTDGNGAGQGKKSKKDLLLVGYFIFIKFASMYNLRYIV